MNRLRTRLRASIADGPLVLLDFLSGGFDSRITFTRGSNATLVDSTGKITYAPANLFLYSQEFDNAAWTKTQTNITANATAAPDGTSTADAAIPNTTLAVNHFVQQTFTSYTSGVTYTHSVYAKASGYTGLQIVLPTAAFAGPPFANFDLANGIASVTYPYGGSGATAAITNVGDGWYRCSVTMTATSTAATGPQFRIMNTYTTTDSTFTPNGTSGIFIWGAQLEQVTYQTTPSTYVATTSAAYYGPRFDYDPVTLAAKGLLIEEARTNLLTGSADFTATYWPTATNVVVTADNTTSPDGTSNADRLADNTTAGVQHRLYRDYTFTAGAHTLSVYAKRNDHRWLRLFFFDGTTSFFANFDLLNGATGAKQASATSTITNAGNGWYRCTMTATAAAAVGNVQLVMLPSDDAAVPVLYTGTGTSLWLFAAQLEAGSFATSYIPTVASQVTRSADVASMTGTNFSSWYNQSEGTLLAQATIFGLNVTAASGISALSNGTSAENTAMFRSGGANNLTGEMRDGGVTQATFTTPLGSQPFNVALAYATNNTNLAQNGAVQTTDTVCTTPTADRLLLGSVYSAGDFPLNGHIRQIAYYNTRLSNTQLQTLTAPSLATTLSLSFTNQAYTVGV